MSMSKNSKLITPLLATFLVWFSFSSVLADDDPAENCQNAVDLIKEDDLEGALEEARWCVTLLEQKKQGQVSAYFKDEINGYKGGKLDQQEAMGFSMLERNYSKDGNVIKVALSGGTSGAANNAFAAIAQFGMSAGAGKKVRIQKRTGMLDTDGGTTTLGVTLKSGGILTFESSDVSADEVKAFAKAFPVAELDDARK